MKNLPVLNNVLLPKTKGFSSTVYGLSTVCDYVYDLTFAYDQNNSPISLIDACCPYFLKGGREVHVFIKRFKTKDLSNMKENDLGSWLIKLWQEKETMLENFNKKKVFNNPIDITYKVESLNLFFNTLKFIY